AHPLLRFLCEISSACSASCLPFSWGYASRLPFLPRVRYGRSILSPAMWTLSATDLAPPTETWHDWTSRLTAWCDIRQVPSNVYVGDTDRRLRLDLDEPAHLHLLRAELNRTERVLLREAPDTETLGWIDGRAHDIVIPLASTRDPVPTRDWPGSVIRRDHGHQ